MASAVKTGGARQSLHGGSPLASTRCASRSVCAARTLSVLRPPAMSDSLKGSSRSCTPNRQQLLQAVLLRRSMMRLDPRPSSATSANSTTSSSDAGWCAHTKQCDGDVDTFSLSSLRSRPARVETGAMGLDSLVASAALSPVSAQHNDPCHGYSGVGVAVAVGAAAQAAGAVVARQGVPSFA